jgi:signal transduction histidine kinase
MRLARGRHYRSPVATRALSGADDTALARQLIRAVKTLSPMRDVALAALLTAVVIFNAATGPQGQPAAGTAVLVLGAIAVGWRRRWPVAVAALAISAYLADHLLSRHTGPGQPAVLIALFTLAAQKDRRPALGATLVAAGAVIVGQSADGTPRASGVAVSLIAVATSTLIGLLVAERRREHEYERQLLADNAAAEERVRIARELHDVVAHHLSVMVVQGNVVAEAMPPETDANAAARAVVDSGRRALGEMRRILDVLRAHKDDDAERLAPRPGLAQLGALVQTVNRTGLQIEVQIEGSERALPEALDLSAYRILQEALTNVLRHAQATTASVRITYAPNALELRITDDGIGVSSAKTADRGHGLAGMRERALMFGGQFSSGPVNGRGYSVQAVLPL